MANEAVIRIRSDAGQALKGIQSVEKSLHRMNSAGGTGRSGNQATRMMTLAQFADDAQYGLRAVTNQVGQLASAFGVAEKTAGGLMIGVVGLNMIMSGQARRWGEGLGKMIAGGKELDKELQSNADTARRMFEEQERGIRNSIKGYEVMAQRLGDLARANREFGEITQATMGNRGAISQERQSRERALVSGAESSGQFARANLDQRLSFENKRAALEKRHILENAEIQTRAADERISVERENMALQLRMLAEAEKVASEIVRIEGGSDSERGKAALERVKAAKDELTTMERRIRVMEIERYGIEALSKERIKTAEQERKIRLNALKEESMAVLQREADDTNSRLRELSGQSMAVGTSLQRVGLGKTPELVQQVDLARKSEAHLAKLVRAMEKLNLGLN